jgi:hypothetical protein
MSNITRQIIEACTQKDASKIKDSIKNALNEKAYVKLQETKENIAFSYLRRE